MLRQHSKRRATREEEEDHDDEERRTREPTLRSEADGVAVADSLADCDRSILSSGILQPAAAATPPSSCSNQPTTKAALQHTNNLQLSMLQTTARRMQQQQQRNRLLRSTTLAFLLAATIATCHVAYTLQNLSYSALAQHLLESQHPLSSRRRRHLRQEVTSASPSTTATTLATAAGGGGIAAAVLSSSSSGEDKQAQPPHLRYLSFGSSRNTWGSRSADADSAAAISSYPHLLQRGGVGTTSDEGQEAARIVAVPAGNDGAYSDLAAACAQSIVGDDYVPNVVTIEYSGNNLAQQQHLSLSTAATANHTSDSSSSYGILLQRLQQRFPDATVIYINIPSDPWACWKSKEDPELSYGEWKQRSEATTRSEIPEPSWIYSDPGAASPPPAMDQQHHPNLARYNLPVTDLATYLSFFDEQGRHLSSAGHVKIANDIQKLMTARLLTSSSLLEAPRLGTWGSGDLCHLWYATGDMDLQYSGDASVVNLLQAPNSPLHKHALTFQTAIAIEIYNPLPTDRMLSLTYLTDSNSINYPKTRIQINGTPTVLIRPFHDSSDAPHTHLARTTAVGYVRPGRNSVALTALQQTSLPFRLLGASILAEETAHLESIEFALETEGLVTADDDRFGGEGDHYGSGETLVAKFLRRL
jgi:hypothetical protein